MYCGKCGAFNNKDNSFCINCGEQIQDVLPTVAPAPPAASAAPTPAPNQAPNTQPSGQAPANTPASSKAPGTFIPGSTFAGAYLLEALIGEGGMGKVYKALDKGRDVHVALKVMHQSLMNNEEVVQRFYNEGRIASQIYHRNIARAIEVGEFENHKYIAMEYIEGMTLRQWIEQKSDRADIDDILEIAIQMCQGLAAAHEYTIHRDMKPENIMITKDQTVKIMDFGIAKMMSFGRVTEISAAMGTAYYVAPEQTIGAGDVDERADVFSVGVILYEMLTKKIPIGDFRVPTSTKRFISKDLGEIVRKALASDIRDRFQSARDMEAALVEERENIRRKRIEDKVFGKFSEQAAPQPVLPASSRPWVLLFVMFFALISLGAIGYFVLQDPVVVAGEAPVVRKIKLPSDLIATSEQIDEQSGLPLAAESQRTALEFVLIPPGEFTRGSNNGNEDEQPVHRVWIEALYMGRYEVSNKEYLDFVRDSGYDPPVNVYGPDSEYSLWQGKSVAEELEDYPVVNVSWQDAMAYCAWLSKKEGAPRGTYRLPTEAEWEKAAKAGNDRAIYPWGNDSPDVDLANFNRKWSGPATLQKVGSYVPNSWGLHDMAGNVWEWCLDNYSADFYKRAEYLNPVFRSEEDSFALRGGSWSSYPALLRVSNRYANKGEVRYFYNGFRVVREFL